MAAAVSVGYPSHCGVGGDCNILYYRASDKSVLSINGSGRLGKDVTLQKIWNACPSCDPEDLKKPLFATVPGGVSGLFNLFRHFGSGKFSMLQLFNGAIDLAENGFPLSPKAAAAWKKYFPLIENKKNCSDFLLDGNIPEAGDLFKNPKIAKFFKAIVAHGPKEFYQGDIARKIISAVQDAGGLLTMEDMKHQLESPFSLPTEPLCIEFFGYNIWEMAPNTIGIVTLTILNLLKGFNLKDFRHNSPDYIHLVAEAIKLAYSDCWNFLCDPDCVPASYKFVLTEEYAEKRRKDISFSKPRRMDDHCSEVLGSGDTSYLTAVDSEGNACSFIFSNSEMFGSCIIPEDCGFVLQDRGKAFSFSENSPNCFGPEKLPLHSILPCIVTDSATGDFVATIGLLSRWVQPQGHVQVLLNMLLFGMDPQTALDEPRFSTGIIHTYKSYINSMDTINLEIGISEEVATELREKGHVVEPSATPITFGKGHVIAKRQLWTGKPSDVLWGGCDRRTDGISIAF